MTEGYRTLIFAGIAAVACGLAWMAKPEAISDRTELEKELIGGPVFASFEDPTTAVSFEILQYNEELGTRKPFQIERDEETKTWRLPSHDNYPADAAEQVSQATTPLVGLKILSVKSFEKSDHSLYGVVNPADEELSVSESGVGMLVQAKDEQDQVLASLVIGKEVEQAEGQRYVRVPSQDATYVVELDTTPFSTDFEKWIKSELLGVRSFDVSKIELRDYAVLPQAGGYGMKRNFDADLIFDSEGNQWSLGKFVSYETGQAVETPMAEDEELNSESLNNLKTAVQDLKIVDVLRKPDGLAADLKADKSLMDNKESLQSLYEQGFFPQEMPSGVEIFATGGEAIITTKDGVKYLLRFGDAETGGGVTEGDESKRFLLVMAQLDDAQFPQPELEPVPESVEQMLEMEKAANPPTEEAGPAEPASEATTAEMEAPAASETSDPAEGEKSDPAEGEKSDGAEGEKSDPVASEESDAGGEATNSETPSPEDVPAKQNASETPVTEESGTEEGKKLSLNVRAGKFVAYQQEEENTGESNETKSKEPAEAEKSQPTQEELNERLELMQERIAKENQRKIEDRKEKMDEARKKVQELNARFADWYYLVSDTTYKKLAISKDQLFKKKGAPGQQPPGNQLPGGAFPGGQFPGGPLPQMPRP